MIQSGKFDSSNMDIKKIINSASILLVNRLLEISGILLLILGILLMLSLVSYSPEDPNFIFPHNTEIKNLLGFQGSFTADIFFQSIGLISYLVAISYILTGLNIFINKNLLLLITNTFFIILYSLVSSFFFSFFYQDSLSLHVNGNGGFIGNFLKDSFLNKLVNYNETFFYYFLIFIITILFFISINFNPKNFYFFLKKKYNSRNKKNYTNENEVISEYIPQEEIKNLIQEDLPFIKAEKNEIKEKLRFKLPDLSLLELPSRKKKRRLK